MPATEKETRQCCLVDSPKTSWNVRQEQLLFWEGGDLIWEEAGKEEK